MSKFFDCPPTKFQRELVDRHLILGSQAGSFRDTLRFKVSLDATNGSSEPTKMRGINFHLEVVLPVDDPDDFTVYAMSASATNGYRLSHTDIRGAFARHLLSTDQGHIVTARAASSYPPLSIAQDWC